MNKSVVARGLSLLILAISFFSIQVFSQAQIHPYYGAEFASKYNQLTGEELTDSLKTILKSGHVQVNPSEYDKLVPSCDSTPKCTIQYTYGYDKARQFLFGKFYLVNTDQGFGIQEMYCQRVYTKEDFKSGLNTPAPNTVPDSAVINVEHTWPQSRFTGKYSKEMQKSDLHHLFPTDSQMNSLRGNTIFGEVSKDLHKTKCPESKFGPGIGISRSVFEPPQEHKGAVARALFYFSIRYDLPISQEEEVVLRKWHHESPISEQEVVRNNEIHRLQGNRNPFIDIPELVEKINNF